EVSEDVGHAARTRIWAAAFSLADGDAEAEDRPAIQPLAGHEADGLVAGLEHQAGLPAVRGTRAVEEPGAGGRAEAAAGGPQRAVRVAVRWVEAERRLVPHVESDVERDGPSAEQVRRVDPGAPGRVERRIG